MAQGVGGGSADDVAQGVLSMFERVHAVVVNIRRSVAAAYASVSSSAMRRATIATNSSTTAASPASILQGMQARLRLLSRGGKLDECDGWSLGAVPAMLEAIVMHVFVNPEDHHVFSNEPLEQRGGTACGTRLGGRSVGPAAAALYAYESRMRYFSHGALHPNEPLPRMPHGYTLPNGWAKARRPTPPASILPPSLVSAGVGGERGVSGVASHIVVSPGSSLASLTLIHNVITSGT